MQVILRKDVDGLGRRGEIANVSAGYYRNYLLPKGLGYKATKGAEADAEAMRKASAARNQETRAEAEEIATRLVPQVIEITARTQDNGALFGSVGASEISAAIEAQTEFVIDRRSLKLDSPLKEAGSHMVMTQIHPEVQFPVTVNIVAED